MYYTIKGRVIKGDGYGRKIGYPTINVDSQTAPKALSGVYAGRVVLSGREYRAGIVIGPLEEKNVQKIEAHLIGYKGNAYGKNATLALDRYIRKFKKFKTEQELIKQIAKDIRSIAIIH